MRPSEKIDWPGLAMLAWVGVFGLLYARTVLVCKAPALWMWLLRH